MEIFEIILKFIYTDELPGDNGINFLHLFAAAEKFKIKELRDFAASKLTNTIDEKNALGMFKISNKYGYEELKQKSFEKIKKKYSKIKFNEKWINDEKIIFEVIAKFEKTKAEIEKLQKEFQNFMQEKNIVAA